MVYKIEPKTFLTMAFLKSCVCVWYYNNVMNEIVCYGTTSGCENLGNQYGDGRVVP